MALKTGKICKNCGYDLNAADVEKCEVCSHSLKKTSSKKTSSFVPGSLFSASPLKPTMRWGLPIVALATGAIAIQAIWRSPLISSGTIPGFSTTHSPNCNSTNVLGEPPQTMYTQICETMRDVQNVPEGRFFYSATADASPLLQAEVVNSIATAHREFRPTYLDSPFAPGDSDSAIESVIAGEASFAVTLNPISAQQNKLAPSVGVILKQIPVATVNLVFYTSPQVGVKSLSVKQLQAIYTGKITNWKQVGGTDLPIVPIVHSSDTQPDSFLLRGLPEGTRQLDKNTVEVRNFNDAVAKVSSIPGAISYSSSTTVVGHDVQVLGVAKGQGQNIYPLMRRVYVVIRTDDDFDQKAGRAYANLLLSDQGQQLIEKIGYLPIR